MHAPACKFKRAMYLATILVTAVQFTGQTTAPQPKSQPRIPSPTPTVTISVGTSQAVLAPAGVASPCAASRICGNSSSINCWGGLASLADEHSSIVPPNTIDIPNTQNRNNEYLFFVAAKTCNNGRDTTKNGFNTSGLVVLQSTGPDTNGNWTLDYAAGYGQLSGTQYPYSQIFLSPVNRTSCPTQQDPTFDLNYANAGSIVIDPTRSGPDSLLMVFEGTNRCVGPKGAMQQSFYSTIGVATSQNWGSTWPAYRTNFTPLPTQSTTNGPLAANGASGAQVCRGNDCSTSPAPPPSWFGRTAALSAPVELANLVKSDNPMQHSMGDSEPSAFVDDVNTSSGIFLYTVENYGTDPFTYPGTQSGTIGVSRARLDQGLPLKFTKWYGSSVGYTSSSSGSFRPQSITVTGTDCGPLVSSPCQMSNSGLASDQGGLESPIFPQASVADSARYLNIYQSCEAADQGQSGGSISYLDDDGLYLLTFVCKTPAKPLNSSATPGTAMFYATNQNLSDQTGWTSPQQISGSWMPLTGNGQSKNCVYDGWYPTFMSLNTKVGHLSNSGYVFSMKGCTGGPAGEPRQYTSRTFTIKTTPKPCTTPEQCCKQAGGTWSAGQCS